MHIQNDIITIEWSPQEKDEYFDAEFQNSLRMLTVGKSEEAGFILEDWGSDRLMNRITP